ncbi:MAG: LysR family transcriptional regulator [Burkholderiales bacterium]|nr:LysR family transcriptional regulator [Burkholderiales bacterium]
MKLSMRQIRYVCEVARQGSIQAACEVLHISQSSVLAAIELAEVQLDAAIFERRPSRGVQITPAGERFVVAARVMLEAEAEFERALGGISQGTPPTLRVGCFEPFGSLFMAELLKQFCADTGSAGIVLFEGDQTQLHEWLVNGDVDLVVTYNIGSNFGNEGFTRICLIPPHVILPAESPLAARATLSIAELSQQPFVLLDLPQTSTYLLTLFDVLAQRPPIALRTRSYETVRTAVAAGLGFSILNMRPTGRAMPDSDDVVRRPLADNLAAPCLIVADVYGDRKPVFVRRFIDAMKQYFIDLGAERFSVTTAARRKTLLKV